MKRLIDDRFYSGLKIRAAWLWRGLLCLLLCIACWVGPGSPAVAATATYTPLQQSQIQKFESSLRAAYDRIPELGSYVVEEDWTNIRNFIHGPLGEVRRYMASINRNRLPKEQRGARNRARELMGHIERLDAAAKDRNIREVQREYAGALEDFELFLDSIPQF